MARIWRESTSISQMFNRPVRGDMNRIRLLSADHVDAPNVFSSDRRFGLPPEAGIVHRPYRPFRLRSKAMRLPSNDQVALKSRSPGPGKVTWVCCFVVTSIRQIAVAPESPARE